MMLPRSLRVVLVLAALGSFTLPGRTQNQNKPAPPPPAPAPAPVTDDEPLLFGNQTMIQAGGLRGWACCVTPDGKTLITCAGTGEQNGEVLIWDLAEGKIRHTIKHTRGIRSVAAAPDNSTLAAASYDGSLRLYDLASARPLAVGAGPTVGINSVAFTGDGALLVTGGLDNAVKVWKTPARPADGAKPTEFKPFASLEEHTSRVLSAAVSKDGKTIVSGGQDNTARVWDMPAPAADGKLVVVKKSRRVISGHQRAVEAVAISPDGKAFATGSWDAMAKLWDIDTGEALKTFPGLSAGVQTLAFSPDGRTLVAGAGNSGNPSPGEVREFGVDEGDPANVYMQQPATVRGVVITPDGKSWVSICEDHSVHVKELGQQGYARELKTSTTSADAPQIVLSVAWSKDGKALAVAGENKGISLHDQATQQVRSWVAHDDVIAALAFSPDGKTLASASHDGTVKLWDVAAWKPSDAAPPVKVLKGHTNWVFAVAFSSDGNKLVSGGYDKSVRIWDISAWRAGGVSPLIGAPPVVIKGRDAHSAGVRAVLFLPGGREVVSSGADRTIRFWDAATGKARGLLRGHKGAIRALALSPDGLTLASGSEDKTVKLWELTRGADGSIDGKERAELGNHQDMIGSMVFSPRGRTLAVGLWNGQMHLWDPSTARQRTLMQASGGAVSTLAWSPDGQKLAAGSYDKAVRVWTAAPAPPPPLLAYEGHDRAVTAVALSADGQWTATGDQAGALRIFERGGKLRFRIDKAQVGGVSAVAFSPDGQTIATGGPDKIVRLWRAGSGEKLRDLPGHPGDVLCVAFSPDGRLLASAGQDKIIAVWDAHSGQNVKKLPGHAGAIRTLAFSPDGSLLASAGADRTYRIWDAKTWAVKHQSPTNPNNGEYYALAFSPDGKTLALAHNQDQVISPDGQLEQNQFRQVILVDVATGQLKPSTQNMFFHNDWVTGVAFAGDGRVLVTACRDRNLRFWTVADGRMGRQIEAHRAAITAMAVDPRSGQVVTGGDDRLAALWSAQFRQEGPRASLTGQNLQVWFAEYSKDGSLLATGGDDGVVFVRRGTPGAEPFQFTGPFGACFSLATSPDGSRIASGHANGDITIWDATSGKKIKTLKGHSTQVWTLTFLADGKRLVSSAGDWARRAEQPGEVRLWDIDTARVIRDYPGQTGTIYAAIPSPDGKLLATASHDQTIRLWELETGKLKHTLKGHAKAVRTVAFTPDGATLISGSHEESTIIYWDVAKGKEKSRQVLPDANANVNRLRVSPDGKTLAIVANAQPQGAGNGELAIPVTMVVNGQVITQYPQRQSEAGTLYVWDLAANKLKGTSGNSTRMLDGMFSPDGSMIATVGGIYSELGEIALWRASDGRRLGELHGHKKWLEAVAFTKDGRLISGGGINQPVAPPQVFLPGAVVAQPAMMAAAPEMEPGELRIWDITGIKPELELKGHTKPVQCAAFHPDGSLLATGGGDNTVIVWSLASARKGGPVEKRVLKHEGQLRAVRFSPDGKILAACDEAGKLRLWDPLTGTLLKAIDAHTLPAYNLAFSPDGRTLATCAGNWRNRTHGEVKFWDVATGKLKGELERFPKEVWSVAYSPDGALLATACGDGQLRVYETATGKIRRTLRLSSPIRNVAFSPDGTLLAAGQNSDADPNIRLWDTTNWQERATLSGHRQMIFTVRFSPDGKTLASASKDATAKLWPVPPGRTTTAMK